MKSFSFLFLISFITFSQENSISAYLLIRQKAELEIINENYEQALKYYNQAFETVKNPFAVDLYHAVVCKNLLGDFENSKPYLYKLAKMGIPIKKLEEKELFENQNMKKHWEDFKPIYLEFLNETNSASVVPEWGKIVECLNREEDLYYQSPTKVGMPNEKLRIVRNSDVGGGFFRDTTNSLGVEFFSESQADSIYAEILKAKRKLFEELEVLVLDHIRKYGFPEEVSFKNFQYTSQEKYSKPGSIRRYIYNEKLESFNPNPLVRIIVKIENEKMFLEDNFERRFSNGSINLNIKKESSPIFADEIIKGIKEGKLDPKEVVNFTEYSETNSLIRFNIEKIKVESLEACNFENGNLFAFLYYKPFKPSFDESLAYQKMSENLGMHGLDNKIKLDLYCITKNKYFDFKSINTLEESTYPSCEIAQKHLKDYDLEVFSQF